MKPKRIRKRLNIAKPEYSTITQGHEESGPFPNVKEIQLALLKTRRFPSSTYNTQNNVMLAAKLKDREA